MIEITEKAISRIVDLLIEENNPNVKLRTFVRGGGCSGFQYGFTFDEDQNEDDYVIEHPGMILLVDAMSMQYLNGSIIDYNEDLMGSSFTIKNPQAQSTCGCGSSFSL
jgi:iron-sulfur cluster insertion protein